MVVQNRWKKPPRDSLTTRRPSTVKALGEVMPWRVDLHHYDLEAGQRKGEGCERKGASVLELATGFDQHI